MNEKNEYKDLVFGRMGRYPHCEFGVADISSSAYGAQYHCAIVIAIPHVKVITLDNYHEQEFESILHNARIEADGIIAELIHLFNDLGIRCCVPPLVQSNEERLAAPFSLKHAAVTAGIGWIGKNDMLVTKKYGPRVRLAAILLDVCLPLGQSTIQSGCSDECDQCVKACPYGALKGVQWDIEKRRDELIDYQLCNTKRRLYIEKHGRKNACGLCMTACPLGCEHK